MRKRVALLGMVLVLSLCPIWNTAEAQTAGGSTTQEQVEAYYGKVVSAYTQATQDIWAQVRDEGRKQGHIVAVPDLVIVPGAGSIEADNRMLNGKHVVYIGEDLILDLLRLAQVTAYNYRQDYSSARPRTNALGDYIFELAGFEIEERRSGRAVHPRELGAFYGLSTKVTSKLIADRQFVELSDYLFQELMASALAHEYGHYISPQDLTLEAPPDSDAAQRAEIDADAIGEKIVSRIFTDQTGASLVLMFRMAYRDLQGLPTRSVCKRSFGDMATEMKKSEQMFFSKEGEVTLKELGFEEQQFRQMLKQVNGLAAACDHLDTEYRVDASHARVWPASTAGRLRLLGAIASSYEATVPSLSCVESVHSDRIQPAAPISRSFMEAELAYRLSRSGTTKQLSEERVVTRLDGQPVQPSGGVNFPYFVGGVMLSALSSVFSTERQKCYAYRTGEGRISFDADPKVAGTGACAAVSPQTSGYLRYRTDTGTLLHMERTVPFEEARQRNQATYAAIEFEPLVTNDALLDLPISVTGMQESPTELGFILDRYRLCRLTSTAPASSAGTAQKAR